MHYHYIEDEAGDLVDLIPFCCDSCNRDYCHREGLEYQGWSGAHEGGDSQEFCANCGTYAGGGTGEEAPCGCMLMNVRVNRILTDEEVCEHGNYVQVNVRDD